MAEVIGIVKFGDGAVTLNDVYEMDIREYVRWLSAAYAQHKKEAKLEADAKKNSGNKSFKR